MTPINGFIRLCDVHVGVVKQMIWLPPIIQKLNHHQLEVKYLFPHHSLKTIAHIVLSCILYGQWCRIAKVFDAAEK
jgi:hypothetical protein